MRNYTAACALALVLGCALGCGGGTRAQKPPRPSEPPEAEAYVNLYRLAVLRFQEGKLDEASYNYRQALEQFPAHAESHYGLGLCHLSQGEYKEALESFELALHHRPDYDEVYISMGIVHSELGEREKAEEVLHKALDSPSMQITGLANYHLGLLQLEADEYERAYYSFRKALSDYPDAVLVHAKMAEALERMGRNEEALEYYLEALEGEPGSAEYTYKVALVHFRLNHRAEALEYFRKTLIMAPNSEYGERAFEFLKMLGERE
ncbi:MAG: tetratricopeptide repeat protein [Acidobacteriota bacterium]|nr:MAG: tetratricopeptide repeat protein [Acidobacteriota bacterium]